MPNFTKANAFSLHAERVTWPKTIASPLFSDHFAFANIS